MNNCKCCKRPARSNLKGYCQSCYTYFSQGGQIHPLPKYGEITYAPNGNCICPFCGKAYRKLGGHFNQSHGLTSVEAHKLAGWDRNAKATNANYRELMRDRLQEKCVRINLLQRGKSTRYKTGSEGRTRLKVTPMTMKRLKQSSFLKYNKQGGK